MRSVRVLAMAMVLVSAALGVVVSSGLTFAESPGGVTAAILSFDEPQNSEGDDVISVSVHLASPDGQPISGRPVEFFVTPDFFGERPLKLRTVRTDATGTATLRYVPTWEGAHRLTARFAGDEQYQPAEASSLVEVSGVTSTYTPEPAALGSIRQWVSPIVIAIMVGVWLILALVLIRVGWGIREAGQRGERWAPSPQERTAERVPGDAPYGR